MDIQHSGTPHEGSVPHSGRYKWGSGEDPYQHYLDFQAEYHKLKKQGMSNKQIAEAWGMSTKELIARNSIANDEIYKENVRRALKLKEKQWSNVAIAEKFGVTEGTVRNWLKPDADEKRNVTAKTAEMLKEQLKDKRFLDISGGTAAMLGISDTRLATAVAALKAEGYEVQKVKIKQLGTNHETTMNVLAPPGTSWAEVQQNTGDIKLPTDVYTDDGGRTWQGIQPPVSISSDRVEIRYAEEGGKAKDGVMEIRRGVGDLDLGNSSYAQVRIAVDDTHYLKGMAMYSDNLPDGVDIMFNSKESLGTPKMDCLKKLKLDNPDNPFGATITRQNSYEDENGEKHQGVVNIVNEEGDWASWSKTLSSQFLSKQRKGLAEQQLGINIDIAKEDFDEIMSLTNPVVREKELIEFADSCDRAAETLKAFGMPNQGSYVILPLTNIPENEIYAPRFKDGDKVVLIRHPHGGKFEIPELIVNNHRETSKNILGDAIDAVGIHPAAAAKLSGADFDGDTVLVIPNNSGDILTSPSLKGLQDFDPNVYKLPDNAPKMTERQKGIQMGRVSNLITDMTLRNASDDELARAVRHSMVVIDAYKHHLDYKQSAKDNGIDELMRKYQQKEDGRYGGASTLISLAGAETIIDERVEGQYRPDPVTGKEKLTYIDPDTGDKLYRFSEKTHHKSQFVDVDTGKPLYKMEQKIGDDGEPVFTKRGKPVMVPVKGKNGRKEYDVDNPNGEWVRSDEKNQMKVSRMSLEKDAFNLSSGTLMEAIYARYANTMKALANAARKASLAVERMVYSPSAAKTYAKEVGDLNVKLLNSEKSRALERQAQIVAGDILKMKKRANPDMDADEEKRLRNQLIAEQRRRLGSHYEFEVTPKEWEAIQAGAVTSTKLRKILRRANSDQIKRYAMPRANKGISPAKAAQAIRLYNKGYNWAELSDSLNVPQSVIIDVIKNQGNNE